MNIICVDDEYAALNLLANAVLSVEPAANINTFLSAGEALEFAEKNKIDVAFLDIEMKGMNGLMLAKKLKDIYGDTNIIFVTGFSEYAREAFDLHASGYILKPVLKESVKKELENLRHPISSESDGVRIQCFGNFEVFIDNKPVMFKRTKSKEALAYLVDRRGASISKKELAATIWEDREYNHSLQTHIYLLISDITSVFESYGINDVIIKGFGSYAANTDKFSCDYYLYEKGDIGAINSYQGEYMNNYSWAEFKLGNVF